MLASKNNNNPIQNNCLCDSQTFFSFRTKINKYYINYFFMKTSKRTLFFLSLSFTFSFISLFSCGQKIDLEIQNKITIAKSSNHEKYPGSQLLIIRPEQYIFDNKSNSLIYDKSNFITLLTFQNISIENQITGIQEVIKSQINQGAEVFYEKEFYINQKKAFLLYSLSEKIGLEQISIVIGNNQNSYILKGYFPAQNKVLRQNIIDTFLTLVVDNSIKLEPTYNYSIEIGKTLYKISEFEGLTHYYTKNGQKGIINGKMQNQIIIQQLPPMISQIARKQYKDSMLDRFRKFQKITILKESQEIINELESNQTIYNAVGENNSTSKNYQLIIGNENETILFTGMAFSNQEIALKEMIELSKTLKLK
jgi:hypothetical protein